MISSPARSATSALRASTAGTSEKPAGEIPRTSNAIAIVLAVNWPPHAPAPGDATSSISFRPASSRVPAACAPTASNTSWIVTRSPWRCPGRIDPP